jgi:hypothetical protein
MRSARRPLATLVSLSCVLAGCPKGKTEAPDEKNASTTWPDLGKVASPSAMSAAKDAAVVVGLESYMSIDKIPGAAANANDWYRYLTKSVGVPLGRVKLLRNQEATRENILEAAREASRNVEAGGRLWFVFVGHGAPARSGTDGYLVGWDAQQNVNSIETRSVSQKELVAVLESGAGTPLVLLDACFSGQTSKGQKLLGEGLQPLALADLQPGEKAVVMTAARADQYAGPLPGLKRPAFSYLMLGATRGWGDKNKDSTVTVEEAVQYSADALTALLKDRAQTPELITATGSVVLGSNAKEGGPDLQEMALHGASASEVQFEAESVSVPTANFGEKPVTDVKLTAQGMEAERRYETAMTHQEDEDAVPEQKASSWCAVGQIKEDNPYRSRALSLCRDWQHYASALRSKERSMTQDYELLRQYLDLKRKSRDQKLAAVNAFVGAYDDLAEGDYDQLDEAAQARRALNAKRRAHLPVLAATTPSGTTQDAASTVSDSGSSNDDSYRRSSLLSRYARSEKAGKTTKMAGAYLSLMGLLGMGIGAGMMASSNEETKDKGKTALYVTAGMTGVGLLMLGIGIAVEKNARKRANSAAQGFPRYVAAPVVGNGGGGVAFQMRF